MKFGITSSEILFDGLDVIRSDDCRRRLAASATGVERFKVVGIAAASAVQEGAALLVGLVVIPALGELFTVADFARHLASVFICSTPNQD